MAAYRVISSDDHVFEPRDLWTSRVDPEYRDRAPRIVRTEDGDWWVIDGLRMVDAGTGSQAGLRFEAPEKLTRSDVFENVRPGGYIPEEHVKDMDIDGVDISIVYPSAAQNAYSAPDSELLTHVLKVYNDWIAEFCASFPRRLKGIAQVNLDDVESGVREIERCAKLGLVGASITVYPDQEKSYLSAEYEPLWASAQDLGMPLSLHIGTNRGGGPGAGGTIRSQAGSTNVDHWVRMSLADIIFSGVFERYPKLQVGSVEHELSWVPHFVDRLDFTYTQRPHRDIWYRFKSDAIPSDFFHSNVFLSFQQDAVGVRLRDIIGVDNLLWGADYPHPESTFPRSQQILEAILADCTPEERAKIVGGNATRVYQLD